MLFPNHIQANPADQERCRSLNDAINEELQSLPDGRMTYGTFVERTLYGYDHTAGYYTNEALTPNNTDSRSADSFGTMAAYPGVGAAIGEIVAIELADLATPEPVSLIEIGGGSGFMMLNMLRGMQRQLRVDRIDTRIAPIMVDRTPQLLDKQRLTITPAVADGKIVEPRFIACPVDDLSLRTQSVGAVVSNELLDMLPFEIACRLPGNQPGQIYVESENGRLKRAFGRSTEQHEEEVADTLKHNPHKDVIPFQPQLIPAFEKMAACITSGVVIAMDYSTHGGSDIQIMRGGVTFTNSDEVRYPGLFDISVTPDWSKILKWARAKFGDQRVEFDPMGDFIATSESYQDPLSLLPIAQRKAARKNRKDKHLQDMLAMHLGNYSALLIRK